MSSTVWGRSYYTEIRLIEEVIWSEASRQRVGTVMWGLWRPRGKPVFPSRNRSQTSWVGKTKDYGVL
jgi:hypothetical protein